MIGDEAFHFIVADVHALEQPLRRLHRPLGGEPQLAAGFLRQRRRRERRRGPFDAGLLFDARDRPRHIGANRISKRRGRRFVQQARVLVLELAGFRVEVLPVGDALVVDARERRDELASLAAQPRLEVPVDRRAERPALFLALDDQPDGDALDPPRAQARLHLLPEQRRQRVAVQPVENAAALLGANEVLVHHARVVERLFDGILGDFVEDDAPDGHLRLEHLRQVPADRFTLAVGVGGQQQLRGILHRSLQVRDLLLLVVRDDVVGREVAVDVHAEAPPLLLLDLLRDLGCGLRQIADVAVARLDPVFRPEETAQRLRLRRRLHDHERLSHRSDSNQFTLARSSTTHETAAADPADAALQFQIEQSWQQSHVFEARRRSQPVHVIHFACAHARHDRIRRNG